MDADSNFKVNNWDEKPYREFDNGSKYTHSVVEYQYKGDLEGTSTLQYLMYYRADGSATFVGLEHFTGSVHGKQGGFSTQINGTYTLDDGVQATCVVVHGSGTDELTGISGLMKQKLVGEQEWYHVVLEYDLQLS